MGMTWGFVWGIWWWRYTGANMRPSRIASEMSGIPAFDSSVAGLEHARVADLRNKALDIGVPQSVPMDLLVSGKRTRVQNRCYAVHQWNGFVPLGSICNAGSGNYVCSPEFCVLQFARGIRQNISCGLQPWQYTVILTELCCEMCGTYSKQNTARGFKERKVALTSVGKLMVFCGRMAHEQGAHTLRKALAWTLDGLNSPMETVLYLLLCLPRSYGGLELQRPLSNPSLKVPRDLWGKTRLRHVIPDLYWPEVGLIVEFNGKDPHEGREVEDQERQEIAQDMGQKVVTFRKEDLYDKGRFMAKARSVAKYLGRSLPSASGQFNELQDMLHKMLLRHERWV